MGTRLNDDNYAPGSEPDCEYMSVRQSMYFKGILQRMLIDIDARADQARAEDVGHVADPVDRATQEEEAIASRGVQARAANLRRDIMVALHRVESGEYGFCSETGEEIGVARLMANPVATLCVTAQSRREITSKLYMGGGSLAHYR